MNTKTKATLGAILAAVGGVLIASYVPEGEARTTALTALGLIAGWLGFAKPGQS
jgi:outer membrane lipoprotein SlyB